MQKEGVEFRCNSHIGNNIDVKKIINKFDAVVLARARRAQRYKYSWWHLKGIHFAMDFLTLQNKICEGDDPKSKDKITAKDKHVVVIGGGDTGSDA